MTKMGVWILTYLCFLLGIHWAINLWRGEHYFWFSILLVFIHDNLNGFRIFVERFFLPIEKEESSD